jgi:hypothetical protein
MARETKPPSHLIPIKKDFLFYFPDGLWSLHPLGGVRYKTTSLPSPCSIALTLSAFFTFLSQEFQSILFNELPALWTKLDRFDDDMWASNQRPIKGIFKRHCPKNKGNGNYAGSKKSLPTLIKEKEPLWYCKTSPPKEK